MISTFHKKTVYATIFLYAFNNHSFREKIEGQKIGKTRGQKLLLRTNSFFSENKFPNFFSLSNLHFDLLFFRSFYAKYETRPTSDKRDYHTNKAEISA